MAVPRRRNGKQQACEPCRKRKMACDHGSPTCQRCVRRGLIRECVYLAAPMTRRKTPSINDSHAVQSEQEHQLHRLQREQQHPNQNQRQQQQQPSATGLTTQPPSHRGSRKSSPTRNHSSPHFRNRYLTQPNTPSLNAGKEFFGSTSFSAVFVENWGALDPIQTDLSETPTAPHSSGNNNDTIVSDAYSAFTGYRCNSNDASNYGNVEGVQHSSTTSNVTPSAHSSSHGIEILRRLPPRHYWKELFSRHINPTDGWLRLAAAKACTLLWSTFGEELESREVSRLDKVARLINDNGQRDLETEDDPTRWINSFSGRATRWETLGILFTYWAFGAVASPENDKIIASQPAPYNERTRYMHYLTEASSLCIDICRSQPTTSLVVYLLYKHNLLESLVSGDPSSAYWRRHGEIVAMVVSIGLHEDYDQGRCGVSIQSETRKRIFGAVFNIDKVNATYFGRPPLLNRRYSSTSLPLDLSDEVLLEGGDALARAVEALDEDGWNTEGKLYTTTILRARTSLSYIRDAILEIALGSKAAEDVTTTIVELKQESTATFAKFPAIITYSPQDINNSKIPGPLLYARALSRLEHLQNLFLLERLLIRHSSSTEASEELIAVCIEMLSLTLTYWKHKDRFEGLTCEFDWLVMAYGVPASGLLCVEILKQASDPMSYRPRSLPRSKIIQNMSLLIGFLEWIRPNAPKANISSKFRQIISKVLDQVLDGGQIRYGGRTVAAVYSHQLHRQRRRSRSQHSLSQIPPPLEEQIEQLRPQMQAQDPLDSQRTLSQNSVRGNIALSGNQFPNQTPAFSTGSMSVGATPFQPETAFDLDNFLDLELLDTFNWIN